MPIQIPHITTLQMEATGLNFPVMLVATYKNTELQAEWLLLLIWIWEVTSSNLDLEMDILIEGFRGFPKFFQENAGIVPWIRPRPLSTTSFPIHYSSYHSTIHNLRYWQGRKLQISKVKKTVSLWRVSLALLAWYSYLLILSAKILTKKLNSPIRGITDWMSWSQI
jgi:hypothetical protein